MRYLFDTSALLNIIRDLGSDSLALLRDGYVLPLTIYEVGNAMWKEATLLNRISIEEALLTLRHVKNTVNKFMKTVDLEDANLALKLAHQLKITYYDASYIAVACELDAKLVTDDHELRRRIEQKNRQAHRDLGEKAILISSREMTPSLL